MQDGYDSENFFLTQFWPVWVKYTDSRERRGVAYAEFIKHANSRKKAAQIYNAAVAQLKAAKSEAIELRQIDIKFPSLKNWLKNYSYIDELPSRLNTHVVNQHTKKPDACRVCGEKVHPNTELCAYHLSIHTSGGDEKTMLGKLKQQKDDGKLSDKPGTLATNRLQTLLKSL